MSYEAGHIGPYELLGELGRGAMARVWRAWDPSLQREVALKEPLVDPRLPPAVANEMALRFVTEGRAAARLSHPGIVKVYAIDVFDGQPAIVMELVEGVTLASLLGAGPFSADETTVILDQLLDAVGYAHACGVVHRDIKPDNIFVTKNGVVKLGDFGVAHVEGMGAARLTVAGSVIGTPGYMSPEQAMGHTVDARSDLFSIGVVAYEMLTGFNPFNADGADATTLIYRIVHEPAPELALTVPDVPAPLARAIMSALAKDPNGRPTTAERFKALLHEGSVATQPQPQPDKLTARTVVTRQEPVVVPSGEAVTPWGDDAGSMHGVEETAGRRGFAHWLPYVLVAAACTVALVVALISATAGGGGGASSATAGGGGGGSSSVTAGSGGMQQTIESGEDDGPYRLTVDHDGTLSLYDAHGRRMEDQGNGELDVSALPAWAVASLESGLTYDTYEEALYEYTTTADDCVPQDSSHWKWQDDPASGTTTHEDPFWCIVIDSYKSQSDAELVAQRSSAEFGLEFSTCYIADWDGLFEACKLYDEAANYGDAYYVITGISANHQEVLEKYLELCDAIGQPLDQRVSDALTNSGESWRVIKEIEQIKYSGTRQHIKRED